MIQLKPFITESFELPSDLQKQLENTTYSALGYLLTPQIQKYKKLLFSNKKENEKTMESIKNVGSYLKGFTGDTVGKTSLDINIRMSKRFYNMPVGQNIKTFKLNIEKIEDVIYLESTNRDFFPNIIIEKDPAGWNFKPYNDFYTEKLNEFNQVIKYFDKDLVEVEQSVRLTDNWKRLDTPENNIDKFADTTIDLQYKKQTSSGLIYKRYFRLITNGKEDSFKNPNAFFMDEPPFIIQTINTKNFIPVFNMDWFTKSAKSVVETSLHEGRHLQQYIGNIKNKLDGDFYGGPKSKLRYNKNTDVRGTDAMGTSMSKDDGNGKVSHPFRDVEFKTNLYNSKEDIENFLSIHFSKKNWPKAFKDLLLYTIGKNKYYNYAQTWDDTRARHNLKSLYDYDRPKFNETVRELYKLIFK
jgi:hypothetical protein